MTGKKFLNNIANSKIDILQVFLDVLRKTGSRYCLIGGIAVNAYVEPVVSLDLDVEASDRFPVPGFHSSGQGKNGSWV